MSQEPAEPSRSKLRRQIAYEAAMLLYQRQESEYYRAKMKAARRVCKGWVKPADLPSNAEIRDQVFSLTRTFESETQADELQDMRVEAIRLMRLLANFKPKLIGSVLTGHIRRGSDIDLHVFCNSPSAVATVLEQEGLVFDTERKVVTKQGETRTFHHIHIRDRFPTDLTIYPANKSGYAFKSSVTGKTMESATLPQLEQKLREDYPTLDLDDAVAETAEAVDRFQVYEALLLPLEEVREDPRFHPESDALYHSLQVFERARNELAYDEEFLTAALLHDIGKAIDPADHVMAGLEALQGFLTERAEWLIEHHMEAHRLHHGKLGARAAKRLRAHESFDELMLLQSCDAQGRQPGVEVCDVDEALDYLRSLHRFHA